jgi:small subunit ribosomal protein S6
MLVLDPNLDEAANQAAVARVSGLVTQRGGTVANVEEWGRRRLAYPIGKFRDGTYLLLKLNMKPESALDMERQLGLIEAVVRHLIVRVETKVPAAAPA